MSDTPKIDQRKFGHSRRFEFRDDALVYTLRDPSGERTFNVPYHVIQWWDVSAVKIKNTLYYQRLSGACFVGFLIATIVWSIDAFAGFTIALLSILTFGGLWIAQLCGALSVGYTHVPMHPVPAGANHRLISIIADSRRDAILDELATRSRASLHMLYGKANLSADIEGETRRLGWLREQAIISPDEYETEVHRLRMAGTRLQSDDIHSLN